MSIFSRKSKEETVKELKAFATGHLIDITDVNDKVFSEKMLGDGVAIQPNENMIYAPCNGTISMIAEGSKHAIGMELSNGAEVLIHVGLDTVGLNGEGFQVFVKEGDKVKQGENLLEFDRGFIESMGLESTCIMVVSNSDEYMELKFERDIDVIGIKTVIGLF